MVEEEGSATGTFRIESTGYSGGEERTIVATFRNANFVSYVWYTKYETGDPVIYGEPPSGKPNYFIECGNFYGIRPAQGGSPVRCADNLFFGGESVNGPMHTADHAGICGSPVFGRNENDRIEFGNGGNATGEGYSSEGHCGESTPVFKGKHILPKETLSIEPPPGDEELKHIVESAYLYEEKTEIILEGATMTVKTHVGSKVTGSKEEKTTPGVAYPPNGVIYVAGSCSQKYSPFGPVPRYAGNELSAESDTTCGNVYVHGEYTKSLTIAAENDVIINGNITTPVNGEGTPTTNALLGLIANNFVRIYHPVVETYEGTGPELETTGVQLESAGHKEVIRAEPLESGLRMEVKNTGSEYEIVITNSKSAVLEQTGMLTEAGQLLTLKTKYIKYTEGTKYPEGKAEALKSFGARSFGVVKISPEKPNLGKELQVEVEEGVVPTKSKVKIKNTKGEVLETKEVEKASQLTGSTSNAKYEQNGASHAQGENEKLKAGVSKWLDETCKWYQSELETFNSTVKLCEYADRGLFACDAPNSPKDLHEPTIYAAMLAVKHGVIVDNFSCGESTLGPLKVYGAVAGLYTNGYSGSLYEGKPHGYGYNANYDNRLQVEEPPHFLNPVQAAWYIQRQTLAPNP
jgi:hypothetical protein